MIWTTPEVNRAGGSMNAAEADMLRDMLDWERATLLWKCAGLTGEQLAQQPIPGSNLSLLGLIRHLSKVERIWFRSRCRGEQIERLYSTPERPDADYEDLDPTQAETAYAVLLQEQELARQAVSGSSLAEEFTDNDGDVFSLRLVFIHMIREYARHNGHADMVRQGVDGVTGA